MTYCLRERFSTVTDCFIYLLVDVDADARKLSKREPADDDVDDNSYATSSGTKGTSCGAILPSHLPFRPQRNYREDSRSTASSTHPHGTMTSQMEGVFSTYQQTRQPGSLRGTALLATVGSKLPCPEDIPSMELAATSAAVRGVGSSFQIDISPHCQYLSTYSSPLSAFGAGSASSDPLYYPHRSTVNPMPLPIQSANQVNLFQPATAGSGLCDPVTSSFRLHGHAEDQSSACALSDLVGCENYAGLSRGGGGGGGINPRHNVVVSQDSCSTSTCSYKTPSQAEYSHSNLSVMTHFA